MWDETHFKNPSIFFFLFIHYFWALTEFFVTNQGWSDVASVKLKNAMLVKALLTAYDILLDELEKLSKAVGQAIDISEVLSKRNSMKLINSVPQSDQFTTEVEISGQDKSQNYVEVLELYSSEKILQLCYSFYITLLRFY